MPVKVQDVVTMHPHCGRESKAIRDAYDQQQAAQSGGSK